MDGSVSYLAQITRRGHGHQESRSFDKRKTAEAWAKKREREIDDAIANGRPIKTQTQSNATLGTTIDRYIKESKKEIGKTKAQVLATIRKEYDIADLRCDKITSQDIVAFAKELHDRPGLESAATVLNYLSHLSAVFSLARPSWGIPLDKQAMDDAMIVCKSMGFTAKSKKRDRRPSLDELELLLNHFEKRFAHRPKSCPMHKVVVFAIFSTRRQEEICRITWADYDVAGQRVLVRDMKHPGDKAGNDTWVELPDPCCAIIEAMPRSSDRIFPFTADALSAAFTRACKALEIGDLHFHDLRHEGASRLFEMGWTVPQVAAVTGHRSWSSLQRYTHLRQTGDKFAGWKWIEKARRK
jgi:integrase